MEESVASRNPIGYVFSHMPQRRQQARHRWWQLCVDNEVHELTCYQHGVIRFGGGVFETRPNILSFQIGIVFENFRFLRACYEL